MPEYLAPGVYVEETSYRAKSIEGVATSTTGFVGQCRWGPTDGDARLVTSFEEFKRRFGGLEDLDLGAGPTTNYLAVAARAFFENGGKRLYVARIYNGAGGQSVSAAIGSTGGTLLARFPGAAGDATVTVEVLRSKNLLSGFGTSSVKISGVRHGDMVEVTNGAAALSDGVVTSVSATIYRVEYQDDGSFLLVDTSGDLDSTATPVGGGTANAFVQRITVRLTVVAPDRTDVYTNLSTHAESSEFLGRQLREDDPPDDYIRVVLDRATAWDAADATPLLQALMAGPGGGTAGVWPLTGGSDGSEADSAAFTGSETAPKSGLSALAEVDDIAIVAAPGCAALSDEATRQDVRNQLISHCELLLYRVAILSVEETATVEKVRELRAQHDSKYAALYFPWVVIKDPNGASGDVLALPPDGFMAGIYGRSDTERGVHTAPANEVVRGVLRFSTNISKGTQDVLNPEGINCLRFFEGRGYRAWGARTISSDPEWKYLNVRRLFIYLERSIDVNTQWVVFEPNNEGLWLRVRMTIESFLTDVWRTGALLGTSPKEAFFVRCDRTTMTQGDLDNGRLIVLIGVAPTKPAEFVIFRIGQWTADASII